MGRSLAYGVISRVMGPIGPTRDYNPAKRPLILLSPVSASTSTKTLASIPILMRYQNGFLRSGVGYLISSYLQPVGHAASPEVIPS